MSTALWNECRRERKGDFNICNACHDRFKCWTAGIDTYEAGQSIVHIKDNLYAVCDIDKDLITMIMTVSIDDDGIRRI